MKTKIIIAIGVIAIAFSSGWIVNGWRLSTDSTTEKLSAIQSNADHFRDATKKINDSANEYLGNSERLEKQIAELKKELAHAKKNRPLPVECRLDADRLRVLKDVVHTANHTAAGQ